jgi:heme-degrading monooxygenase HmoA
VYVRVWEYRVPPDLVDRFADAYGADGAWGSLFARAPGLAGTELFRAVESADRFLTVDRWQTERDWHAFLNTWRNAYDTLDDEMAGVAAVQSLLFEATLPEAAASS